MTGFVAELRRSVMMLFLLDDDTGNDGGILANSGFLCQCLRPVKPGKTQKKQYRKPDLLVVAPRFRRRNGS
jgi:hypothetical protein